MEVINQSSELVTSRQNGIIESVRVRVVSDLEAGFLQQHSVSGENGAKPSYVGQVSREDYGDVSIDMSYSESDKSSMDADIARLIDDMEVKVNNANDCVENIRNETKIIMKKYNVAMEKIRNMAAVFELHFKTILSVKSMGELRKMQAYLSDQEMIYSEIPNAYERVSSEISDLITHSLETTRNNVSGTNLAGFAPNLEENEPDLDQDVTDLEELGRENNNPEGQGGVSANTRTSTPTGGSNITRPEVSQTVAYNRKLNVIISNVPENLNGGDKSGIEIVLENIGCGSLIQQIEKFSRLGEPRERDRLLKLEMKSVEYVEKILSNKEKLNDSLTPEVYINEDLSRSERARAYHARVTRRSTAAEALEISGREWGRNHSGENFTQEYERQQGSHTNNTGGMGGRGRGGNDVPHQQRQQRSRTGSLPEGWEVKKDISSGQIFYVNKTTRDWQWEFPTETARNHSQGRNQRHREDYQGQNGRGQLPNRIPNIGNRGDEYNVRNMGNYRDQGYPEYR